MCVSCRSAPSPPKPPAATIPGTATPAPPPPPSEAPSAVVQPPSAGARTEDERNTIAIFRAVAPSTVYVTQTRVVMDYLGDAQQVPAGSGSGFVWDAEGHVVTNFHVVNGARSLTVTFQNQKTFDAAVVGVDPHKDVAVLKVEAPQIGRLVQRERKVSTAARRWG